jgi:predicted ArsR family transcriptional regulator
MKESDIHRHILQQLKRKGRQSASELASLFSMTGEGMRMHLLKLEKSGWISAEKEVRGVGRPVTLYRLTPAGNKRFPDNHALLTVQLLETARQTLGEAAVHQLLLAKKEADTLRYGEALQDLPHWEDKLKRFSELREQEGYFCEATRTAEGWILIENHCPIDAAAECCGQFCQNEKDIIQGLLGNTVRIERTEHRLAGSRRCTYRIWADPL